MAAFDKLALKRTNTILLAGGVKVHFFDFATNDLLSEVTTAGYMNAARDALTLNSIIHAVVDVDGTPNYVDLRVTAWSATGNCTVAIDTPAS